MIISWNGHFPVTFDFSKVSKGTSATFLQNFDTTPKGIRSVVDFILNVQTNKHTYNF